MTNPTQFGFFAENTLAVVSDGMETHSTQPHHYLQSIQTMPRALEDKPH
jgi:hypothetical protein